MGRKQKQPNSVIVSDDAIAELAHALAACKIEAATHAIGIEARAQGMRKISRRAGVARESLYRTLSGEQDPRFGTIARVLRALGLQLRVERVNGEPL